MTGRGGLVLRLIGMSPHKTSPGLKRRPIVGIPCDVKMLGPHPFHAVGEKYIAAVDGGAQCRPVLIPAPRLTPEAGPFDVEAEINTILSMCDGIFLTGSVSNVHPKHYDGPAPRDGVPLDEQRDTLTLDLIRTCVERAVPLFCVCRGFQELNVAFGGSLYQHIHEIPSEPGYAPRLDHREDKDAPLDIQYGPAHDVVLTQEGIFHRLLGTGRITVNSLHGQGVARPADRLVVEGRAPDGTVEAASIKDAAGFALGVQWHPEWKYWENPVSQKLLKAFGAAVRDAAMVTP